MNKKFTERLESFLSSECDDYDLAYDWEWCEDCQWCEVEVKRLENSKILNFKYNEKDDDLLIELCEDSYYITREYDQTVKYFWMLIAPSLFPDA